MRVDLFDFTLPPERIALRPLEPRESARLLRVLSDSDTFENHYIRDLPELLRPSDILIVNDTKVIPARLDGIRIRGAAQAKIEVMLHQRIDAAQWWAFIRPAKKLLPGEEIIFAPTLKATLIEKKEGGECLLAFSLHGPELDAQIAALGQMPLPPYIAAKRAQDEQDAQDYQTLFATHSGAVAAPTAGLHFTPQLMEALKLRGIEVVTLTLHVGAGTFLPVKAQDTQGHVMHAEVGVISPETAAFLTQAKAQGRRLIAVGTTSLRLLESATDTHGHIRPFADETRIFISPGYQFKCVDGLITNFHLPRSTLFMLVSAFSGLTKMQAAYQHAIAHDYRFYSYGDACLLERQPNGAGI